MGNQTDFEPQILAFACHYCAYAAADLAGSMRLNYPTNIKIVKLPCTGKVDALYLLKSFCLPYIVHFKDSESFSLYKYDSTIKFLFNP